jgi:ribosomal protein RSM22 (predicted rRNA methylase)
MVSRRLLEVRERLRPAFDLVAPCTHQAACPMLAADNATHWCHQFASPPPEVFTNSDWARFGRMAGIDLRSLPLSFLVLDKRSIGQERPRVARVIGRPRIYKAHALVLGCDAAGLQERRLTQRLLPEEFRLLKKGQTPAVLAWKCQGQDIVELNIDATGKPW